MNNKFTLYTGSYSEAWEHGICGYQAKEGTADLASVSTGTGISCPSYLTVSSDSTYLYAVSETMTYEGETGGSVAAFQIKEDALVFINALGTKGTLPCHVLLDEERGFLYVSNYMSGSISMFTRKGDGSIGLRCDFHQHEGSGPNLERQECAHVHFAGFSKDREGIWCVDLGLDILKYYIIDEADQKLVPCPQKDIPLPKGVGPRHFVLSAENQNIMYVVCELSSEVMAIDCSADAPRVLQRISTLYHPVEGNTCAALKLSENGKFLYVSNRGDDSIAVFSIKQDTGHLSLVEIVETQGKNPRDFAIHGGFMFVANQDSDSLVAFAIDGERGTLRMVQRAAQSKKPVCVVVRKHN